MLDSFLIYSILTGIAIAASLCPLGCVVLWRKMPYFGDAVSFCCAGNCSGVNAAHRYNYCHYGGKCCFFYIANFNERSS